MKREIKNLIEFPDDVWRVKIYKLYDKFETKNRNKIKQIKEDLVNEDVIIKVKNITYNHSNKKRNEETENGLENEEN